MLKELVVNLLFISQIIKFLCEEKKRALCGNHNRPFDHSCDILSATKVSGLIVAKLRNL